MAAFHYNFAIICRVPNSLKNRSVGSDNYQEGLDLEKTRQEYETIREVLKNCDINIIELVEDENYPDCCFVDDTAVVIGNTALIARPGHSSRQGEVGEIRKVLKGDLKMNVVEIQNPKATLDGGDVLFTGKEIFVGVGKRTNDFGAQAVAEAFPEYAVSKVNFANCQALHLKDVFNMAGRNVMAVAPGPDVQLVLRQMQDVADYPYNVMQMDTTLATDMLFVNGHLIHHVRNEMGDKSYGALDEKILWPRHHVQFSELSKVGGTIGSLALLITRTRNPKRIISNIQDEDLGYFTMWKRSDAH
ncbi:N(G),N(G)-dimethylarginine dimethylaminohydrolase 1-like isoform X1 [Biomphalaria glabrata]|uniref:N(G),N(G)-dimethylarginine dimethylaminohydrolase 1-like isoform X1 n=1 Tax=Biomphalaria glabrata TaxID=6526 RepID=A0A9U8EBY1_BIOGL|nr:N(G),N(G)-dimethylarginine dimethylaminohydrolase 1-like isoform X1 [Biomphalaria glabrata]